MESHSRKREGEVSFFPTSWWEIRQGDRIISLSGTERTVLDIAYDKTVVNVEFRTRRTSGDVEVERARVVPSELRGIREVVRFDPNAALKISSQIASNGHAVRREEPPAPHSSALPHLSSFKIRSWLEVKPGDVLISYSGTRRLVHSMSLDGQNPSFHCLVRTAEGQLSSATLETRPDTVQAIDLVLRSATAPRAVRQAIMMNVETFLGRGSTGDQFVQTMFMQASDPNAASVSVPALVDEDLGVITDFVTSSDLLANRASVEVVVNFPPDSPVSIAEIRCAQSVPAITSLELRYAGALSNALKGVG